MQRAITILALLCVSACGHQATSSAVAAASSTPLPVIDFEKDGVSVKGTLRAGQPAAVHYSQDRLLCPTQGGEDGADINSAVVYAIENNQAVNLGQAISSGIGGLTSTDIVFTIPAGYSQLALYVLNQSRSNLGLANGCQRYDSNFGANWLFPVK